LKGRQGANGDGDKTARPSHLRKKSLGTAPGLICELTTPPAMVRLGIGFDGVAHRNNEQNSLTIGRNIMLEVTEAATQQIAEYFKGKEVQPIRIFLNEGG
jgi:hypothetical protein